MTDPGWYPDPQGPGQLRWWDGSRWTTHVATPSGPPPGPYGYPPADGAVAGVGAYGQPPRSSKGRPWVIGLAVAGGLALVVLVLLVPFLLGRTSTTGSRSPAGATGGPRPTTTAATAFTEQAERAGIPVLDEEGSATHTHTMLHVRVDGDDVVVPAGIGIDPRSGQITAVHTHEDHGVLHVESPRADDVYTIGQFLVLWGLDDDEALCATFAGGNCAVTYHVVAPSASDRIEFERLGPMPDEPPIEAAGRDTDIVQGAVIEIDLVTLR